MTPRHILLAGLTVLLAVVAIWKFAATATPHAVLFAGDWRYRWDRAGQWHPWHPEKGLERGSHGEVWLEMTLPDTSRSRPALFIPAYTAFQSFEVRLADRPLYRSGDLPAGFSDRHRYLLWHLIDLPADAAGKTLAFHFSSTHPRCIGLDGPVWLGEPSGIQKQFVLSQLPVAILAALFALVGTASLGAARFFTSSSRAQLSAFAQTSLGAGCYLFSESSICQLVIEPPVFASYCHYLSFFLFVTGVLRYFEPMTAGMDRTINTRVLYLFAVYPLIATVLDLTGLVSWDISFTLALLLVMVAVCWFAAFICSRRFTASSPHDAALIRAAFIPLLLSGLFDAAVGLRMIGAGPLLYPWGLLILMGVLFYRILALDREERVVARLLLEKARLAEETAIVEERRRMAREIHDGVAQDLAMMHLRASVWDHLVRADPEKMTEEIARFLKLLHKNIGEVRRAILALRPAELEELDFGAAIGRYVREFGQYAGLRITLDTAGAVDIPRSLEPELYRIIQESLNNVAKHAGATEVTVTLRTNDDGRLALIVSDNGRGFDPATLAGTPRLGLRQMRERIERRNGTFLIESQLDRGTSVTIRFPVTVAGNEGLAPLSP